MSCSGSRNSSKGSSSSSSFSGASRKGKGGSVAKHKLVPSVESPGPSTTTGRTSVAARKAAQTHTKSPPQKKTRPGGGESSRLKEAQLKSRELFISEASDTYPVSALRGKCQVAHYQDIASAHAFKPDTDSFFYVLGYNPETKRLATTQGEIRVGSCHQARLPEYKSNVMPSQMPEKSEEHEVIRWHSSSVMDGDLMMYLRAARSVAAFAGMCDGGSTDDGCAAASMDETTINAMDTLHSFNYDTGKALQALVKCPVPRSVEKKWTDDDAKRFVKGLRQYGKDFFKIRKELFANKETGELVEYYYFWKKTPAALSARPHRRHRKQGLKRQTTRSQRPPSSEFLDSSGSDSSADDSGEDSEYKDDTSSVTCHRCFAKTSKDSYYGGDKESKSILCTDCYIYYRKHGEERPIDSLSHTPDFLFKPVKEDDDQVNGKVDNMRTRRTKDNNPSLDSPAAQSKKRQLALPESEDIKYSKKKKGQDQSDSESSSASSSEENGNEGDIENNQDELSSSPPSSLPPSPSANDSEFNSDTSVLPLIKREQSSTPDSIPARSESERSTNSAKDCHLLDKKPVLSLLQPHLSKPIPQNISGLTSEELSASNLYPRPQLYDGGCGATPPPAAAHLPQPPPLQPVAADVGGGQEERLVHPAAEVRSSQEQDNVMLKDSSSLSTTTNTKDQDVLVVPNVKPYLANRGQLSNLSNPGLSSHLSNPGLPSNFKNLGPPSHLLNPGLPSHMTNPGPPSHLSSPGPPSHVSNHGPPSHLANPEPALHLMNPGAPLHLSKKKKVPTATLR